MTALPSPSWRVVRCHAGGWMLQAWGPNSRMIFSIATGASIDDALGLASLLRSAPVIVPGATSKGSP